MEEKIYCTGNNDALAYAAMTNNNRNDAMNNPMWLIWAMLFGGGNGFFGGRGAGAVENAEINARLNSIERQAHDADCTDLSSIKRSISNGRVGSRTPLQRVGVNKERQSIKLCLSFCFASLKLRPFVNILLRIRPECFNSSVYRFDG